MPSVITPSENVLTASVLNVHASPYLPYRQVGNQTLSPEKEGTIPLLLGFCCLPHFFLTGQLAHSIPGGYYRRDKGASQFQI